MIPSDRPAQRRWVGNDGPKLTSGDVVMPRPEEGHLAEEVSGRVPAAVLELLAAGRPMAEIADLEIGQSTIYKTRGKPSFAATVSGPGPTVDRD